MAKKLKARNSTTSKKAKKAVGKKINCVLMDWESVYEYCRVLAGKMRQDKFKPDVVIAIARGGYVPARNLCDQLGITDLTSVKVDHWGVTATKDQQARLRYPFTANLEGKKVLLIDDLADTGESFRVAVPAIQAQNPAELRTASLFVLENSKYTPDYYASRRKWAWIIFPWNFTEDCVNLIAKLFKPSEIMHLKEVSARINESYGISVSHSKLLHVMQELEQRGLITSQITKQNEHKWKLL